MASEQRQAYTMYSAMKTFISVKIMLSVMVIFQLKRGIVGQLTLSPMSVAPVCHVGGPLQLTCTAAVLPGSIQTIRWSIFHVINDQGTLSEITNSILIDNSDAHQRKTKEVAATTFTYARISAQEASPLVSTLSIDSVSIGLNGTVVICSDISNPMISASTTIQVIDIDQLQYGLMLYTCEEYSANNITVTINWIQQLGLVYNASVTVVPLQEPLMFNESGSSSVQLVLEYNTVYNLSVIMAVASCDANYTEIFITLNYANCGYAELSTPAGDSHSVPTVEALGDTDLPVQGITFTFRCSPGWALMGPNSTTCMETGKWEPDPSEAVCIVACEDPLQNLSLSTGIQLSLDVQDRSEPAIVGTTISFNCSWPEEVLIGPNTVTCTHDGQWDPDPLQIQISCKVSCDAPKADETVHYLTNNSTALEGSNVTYWCITDIQLNTFTSVCYKNASWVPDPISHCAALQSGEEGADIVRSLTIIAGGLLGALAVILLILVTAVGTVILVQKGSLIWRRITKRKLTFNVDLNEAHNNTVHGPQNEESIVYAAVGPFSSGQSRSLETFLLDDDRVEYAQINYNIMAQNCMSDSVDEAKFDAKESLNLDSLMIRLKDYKVTEKWHQFGAALGVEKVILDRCLNYPPEKSIVEILDHWLRSCDLEERNWRDVAKALRQIEHNPLTEEMERTDLVSESDIALHQPELDPSVVNEPPPPIPPKKIQCHNYPEDSKCRQNLT